eukprot:scaffold82584_cov42-Attheya_sp.AAC.1
MFISFNEDYRETGGGDHWYRSSWYLMERRVQTKQKIYFEIFFVIGRSEDGCRLNGGSISYSNKFYASLMCEPGTLAIIPLFHSLCCPLLQTFLLSHLHAEDMRPREGKIKNNLWIKGQHRE